MPVVWDKDGGAHFAGVIESVLGLLQLSPLPHYSIHCYGRIHKLSPVHFIGWDVGGWNCDKNIASRDAVAILSEGLELVGTPWRGNLTKTINEASSTSDFVARLFALCNARPSGDRLVVGIDTPLGFSDEFVRLASERRAVGAIGKSAENPYLFRATERFLHERNKTPLSPIKDMIGSQATKGMHVLARFAPHVAECGVWTDGDKLRVIEVYPSPCKTSATFARLRERYPRLGKDDLDDAVTCALVASLYENERAALFEPPQGTSTNEGWIWFPKDAVSPHFGGLSR